MKLRNERGEEAVPNDVHIHFRLPPNYAKKLKAIADANGTSPSLAARFALIEILENSHTERLLDELSALHEELAEGKAQNRELQKELRAFRAEFHEALKRTTGEAPDGSDHRPAQRR